ncbi:MAG: hypothetical protein AB8H47_19715 [Bacteroidia bacterium]
MTKRVHIEGAHDYDEYIIGIASDERVWKLCFELNNILNINMLDERSSTNEDVKENEINPQNKDLLFETKALESVKRPLQYYEDTNSIRGREFALFVADSTNLPKTVRAFRYFLLLRIIDPPPPDLNKLIELLNGSALVRSAVNITHVKNIKSLIP